MRYPPAVLAFHVPHTTTEQIELEPDLNYLGHRYALRALILAQPGHFVTISRRWCGRPRRPVWLYQDSMHDPEPVLTAIARQQDQRGATRTATDPTMEDFHTLCSLVGGAFRGLLYTLEGPLPPSPQPDATEDSPTHQHVAESSTPDDPRPTADHHHLGPAAHATTDPTLATNPRKRPPPTDMTERRGAQRGKLIPGVDVLNATWLTSPPQAVLDASRTAGTTAAVAAMTAAADCPGDIAPTVPPPQQSQQPEEDHEAEPAEPQQQQPQQEQQEEQPPGADPDVEPDAATEHQETDHDVVATAAAAHPPAATKKKRRRRDRGHFKPQPTADQRRKAKKARSLADAEQSAT